MKTHSGVKREIIFRAARRPSISTVIPHCRSCSPHGTALPIGPEQTREPRGTNQHRHAQGAPEQHCRKITLRRADQRFRHKIIVATGGFRCESTTGRVNTSDPDPKL
jgi:hypothetical protein